MFESIKILGPIKRSKIDVKKDAINHYEPKKINGPFIDKYNAYKSKGDENNQSKNILKRLDHIGVIW